MANTVASYDQLAHQVEALRKENSHLRRELEDNSNHLSKLETETTGMKEVLKQLQSKLEQEAGTLASSGRSDVLHQLTELHMDLTNYYELKHQPHNLRLLTDSLEGAGLAGVGGAELDDRLALPPSSCSSRARSPLQALSRLSAVSGGEAASILLPHHFLDGAPPKTAVISGADGRMSDHHQEELYKERNLLLGEIDREERERCWYFSQLEELSQRLAQLPRIDTFSLQMDMIRQQLEFEGQRVRSVMEERFGTSDEMVQRTQMRVSRLEQLEKELQEARGSQETQLQLCGAEKPPAGEPENNASSSAAAGTEASADGGSKVEMVFWLLSMLANRDKEEMSRTLLALSSSQDSCIAMRKSGCVPLLVQILHEAPVGGGGGAGEAAAGAAPTGCSKEAKSRASAALHNIIYSQQDEGQARREMRVLHMLEQVRTYCDSGWDWIESHAGTPSPGGTKTTDIPEPVDPQICQAMCAVMKLSFEEEYRRAMNELGGLQVVADLIHLDHDMYGMQNDPINMALRRYAGMAVTNLTFGDVVNKATLCSKKSCLQALVAQLSSDSEELHQVVSSILRNLSWRADISSKTVLRDIGCVSALMTCALQATKESTLKSLLSALWNMSAHSIDNKVSICSVDGALGFLVSTLTYRCQTNSLAIIESGGGILRNVSSLVATREDYRQILRDHNCLQTLLQHLRSHSLTIVSNACGTLWNLSARSPKDQELLWDLGAVSMLRNLIHSKHKMIAMGSAAALRNLLTNRPLKYKDTAVISPGSCMPSLYMRKQKALEAELDAKHLAETFDTLEKQSPKHLTLNKPLRHIESLAKDYASDSGCFDDDEAPNVSSSLETGSFSMLSMFLTNSNFLQNQPRKRDTEPERDVDMPQMVEKRLAPVDDVSAAAEKLAKKITNTVAKIDRLVEDITMHTSSEDSFSLSSEDHLADWPCGLDELNEARAKSCSPCRLSDTSSLAHRERLSRAHALLRLKTAHTSVSTDSLNSGSTSDGYCGSKDQMRPAPRALMMQQRPNQLDLKVAHQDYLNVRPAVLKETSQQDIPERDSVDNKDVRNLELSSTDAEKIDQDQPVQTPVSASTKLSSDVSMTSIKLSPSYQQVPLIQSVAKFGVAKTAINVQAAQAMRRQAWVPTVMTGGSITKFSPMTSTRSPTIGSMETVQKYSVENTPICFSRCSSLSSLSSGDGALDGQSENELESDSSLEIIEVEDGEVVKRAEEDETLEDLSDSQLLMTDSKTFPSKDADPIEIPCPAKREKVFLRGASPAILEDRSPSSSSENYIHETPLVMSRCSSVSSLGSFEASSIASSIQSDPCSEMIDGTISPSDLPDSPGQTMPPSRSKTPCCIESNGPETQATGIAGQWESSLRTFMEIADSKERFNLPPDLDTMIYFTVEKPSENFSCASSLSALPLHEHYIQKDVELKLTPLLQQNDRNLPFPDEDEQGFDHGERYSEGNSDDDIEILKECINSAMPSKFRKVRSSLMTTIPPHILNSQIRKQIHLPMYMMLPNGKSQMCPGRRIVIPQKDFKCDDSSFTDSAEGTPVNFSSTTSLSDETLQYPVKERGAKDCTAKGMNKQELLNDEAKRIEDLRIFSHFHKPNRINYPPEIQMNRTTKHIIPTQRVLMQSKEVADRVAKQRNRDQSPNQQKKRQGQGPVRKLDLPIIKQNTDSNLNVGSQKGKTVYRQTTHSSEDSNSFSADKNEAMKRTSRKQIREANRNTLSRSMINIGRIDNSQAMPRGFHKIKQNLMKDESLACYSLSSSLSSLSDAEFEDHKSRAQQIWYKNRHNKTLNMMKQTKFMNIHSQYEEPSSPSSVSMDSEDDLLQKCITSAMPKQRRKLAARKKKAENTQKQKASDGWNEEMDSDDTAWDKDSDLNSVEWRAIQEGANCVVTGLQASKSQDPSSEETESVMSFMSTSSFTPKERKFAKDKKANKPLDFAQRKPVPNLPMVFRGRTVIYTPKKETAPSQIPPPRKVPTKTDAPKNPNLAQHRSKSLHRLGHPQDIELSLPKRSSTPPPRIPKSSSSGSSQSSTPSKQSQKKITSPIQTNKSIQKKNASPPSSPPASSPPERKGRSTVVNQNEKSPPPKTQKSPVRIPFMQNSVRPRALSPLVTNQTTTRQTNQVNAKRVPPANRYGLVRMTSVHSSSGESERNGFLRQLTFIKESQTMLRRDGSARNMPGSQNGSPHRAVPGASAVFLCSSRCQELKVTAQTQRRVQVKSPRQTQQAQRPDRGVQKQMTTLSRATSSERDLSARRQHRRTSSESPCRVAERNGYTRVSGPRQQQDKDNFKRHASSPSINILSRVTSRSSLRSSSSDSSGRAKSEDDTKKKGHRSASRLNDRVTWRRIRDEDVPQILKSTLPANALPLVPSPDGEQPKSLALPGKLPTILLASRKTSDATVQTEDFSNNKTNSSTSPTVETTRVISEEVARLTLLRKISATSGSNLQDGDSDVSLKSHSTVSTGTSDIHVGGAVHFRQGSPSKAARITPFNYTPSPISCSLQDTPSHEAPISEKSGGKSES
ncbi:adenomatous polyposis coli protein 2 isoform X1 [Cebidichthys violaceus]|uniref:adenomatous polyposis coli protein 2 isoform X1 n=1 Tax=Cebidichthys violaceus TaxID=271503 RepID=UPI0035CA1793